jgi:transcriptional regulator with XRE-family HTH domain
MAPASPSRSLQRTRLAAAGVRPGVSQEELSALTGIPLRTVQRLDRGEVASPRLSQLANCALVLGVDVDALIEDEWRQWTHFPGGPPRPPSNGRAGADEWAH